MAKFATVGYGSEGQGLGKTTDGYTYVVNDNVRTGDMLQPSVKHSGNGAIFATTGKVLGMTKENSAKGKQTKAELQSKGIETANAYTGKELGATGQRGVSAKQKQQGDDSTEKVISNYNQQARGGNILARKAEQGGQLAKTEKTAKAVESYETYSKKFMGGNYGDF